MRVSRWVETGPMSRAELAEAVFAPLDFTETVSFRAL